MAGSSEVYFEQLDISDESSVNAFAKRVKDKYKDVAILVNNAGTIPWLSNFATNDCTFPECVQAIIRGQKKGQNSLTIFSQSKF